jgi:Cys-tRNA(Pro)/Cys-tRNA(Cys) deacylase
MCGVTPAIRALDEAGIDYDVHEYDRGDDLRDFGAEAAAGLHLPEDQVFKTLVVVADDPGTAVDLAVMVVPVSCTLSLKRAAEALGVKRVSMCDPARAERSSGYVVGGISPIGQKRRLPTVLDETVELFDRVYVSGGKRGLDVSLAPADLARVLDAAIAPLRA